MKQVHVAVGVIRREQQIFICKRPDEVHQGGLWEFPGGKVESGETVPEALTRELREEVGIEVKSCSPMLEISHDYGDKRVLLDIYLVDQFSGEAHGAEGQPGCWVAVQDLQNYPFPAANVEIISHLQQMKL